MNNERHRNKKDKTTKTTLTKSELVKVKGWVKLDTGKVFVESAVVDGKPAFIVKKLGQDEYEIKAELETPTNIIKPCLPEQCPYDAYSFTSEEIHAMLRKPIAIEELLDGIYHVVNRFVFAKDEYKTLIAVDILLSYAQEHLSTVHFPFAVGETESGKSSVMFLVMRMGYRPLYGEGINRANVYNYLGLDEDAAGIIAEDEAHQMSNDISKINLYKNSYSKGSVFPVIISWDGTNKRQIYYKVFCQKWFAGENVPNDKGFVERLAIIYMMSGKTDGNIKNPTKDELAQLIQIRKQLLAWKIQNVEKKWASLDSGLKQRDKELWEEFLAATHGTKYYEHAQKTVDFFVSQRAESIKNSLEAYLFETLMEDFPPTFEVNFEDFWGQLASKENSDSSYSTISTAEHDSVSKNTVSKIFIEKFQAKRTSTTEKGIDGKFHKKTCYKFERKMCQNLCGKYKLTLPLFHPVAEGGQSGTGDTAVPINPEGD